MVAIKHKKKHPLHKSCQSTALAHMMSFQNHKWHLPRFLVGGGRNDIIPPLNNAVDSKAEPPQESVLFQATIGHKFPAIDPGRCFQLATGWECPFINRSTPCSYLWPQLHVNPYSSPLRKCVSPWRLGVALANRQDKVKGHHRSIVLWQEAKLPLYTTTLTTSFYVQPASISRYQSIPHIKPVTLQCIEREKKSKYFISQRLFVKWHRKESFM
jgi:hypothetical protein